MAHTLHFSLKDLRDMTFEELVVTWLPVAREIMRTNGEQMVLNMLRGLRRGK